MEKTWKYHLFRATVLTMKGNLFILYWFFIFSDEKFKPNLFFFLYFVEPLHIQLKLSKELSSKIKSYLFSRAMNQESCCLISWKRKFLNEITCVIILIRKKLYLHYQKGWWCILYIIMKSNVWNLLRSIVCVWNWMFEMNSRFFYTNFFVICSFFL